jgi:hypothetical protein
MFRWLASQPIFEITFLVFGHPRVRRLGPSLPPVVEIIANNLLCNDSRFASWCSAYDVLGKRGPRQNKERYKAGNP